MNGIKRKQSPNVKKTKQKKKLQNNSMAEILKSARKGMYCPAPVCSTHAHLHISGM
jgi:hypothetical protein